MCIFYIWWCGNKVLKTQVPSHRVSLARSQLRNGTISLDTSGWAECCERKGYSHVTYRHNDCVASQSAFKTRKQKYFLHKPKEARRRWNVFTLPRNPYRTENKRLKTRDCSRKWKPDAPFNDFIFFSFWTNFSLDLSGNDFTAERGTFFFSCQTELFGFLL